MANEWTTQPGDRLTRAQLAARYGGNPRAGRIMASDSTPNVLLFSDPPERGRPWEVHDGPESGGGWWFTGRGSSGDQQPAANRALWHHVAQGRALRLFVSDGYVPGRRAEVQRYVGEFRVDLDAPFRREQGPDRDGAVRWVLVFHLLPVGRRRRRRRFGAGAEAGAAAPPEPGAARSCNVVAHLDDDLLFLNPSLQLDLDHGRGVRTIVLTGGDAGLGEAYWRGREVGLKAAYAQMAGVADAWTPADAGVAGHAIAVESLDERPDVSLVFLRLPDGNMDGSGFASTGHMSLQRLWTSTAASATSLDGAESYTADDLVATLAVLMAGDAPPAVVRMLDFVGAFGDGDHSDHHASAYFALSAARAAGITRRVGHVGYPIAPRPHNLDDAQIARKLATFLVYAAHDPQVPTAVPGLGDYGPWLGRYYPCGTGNIADLAEVTASSADAATGRVAARAVDGWAFGAEDSAHEWVTVGGGAGSWLRLAWPTAHTVRRVVLYDRADPAEHVLAGRVVLPDGREFPTGELGGGPAPTTVELPDVEVDALTFVVDEVSATTTSVGLTEIEVLEANLAPDAAASASSENEDTGQVAWRAVDGVASGYPVEPLHEWATRGGGVGSWLQLAWSAPRLVQRVVLHDRPNDDDRITSARLSFSDGTAVDVPDVVDGAPIDFAPRLVSWLTLTVTGVSDTTQNVGLAEIRVEGS